MLHTEVNGLLCEVEWLDVELLSPYVSMDSASGILTDDVPLLLLQIQFSSSLNLASLLIITLSLIELYNLYDLD